MLCTEHAQHEFEAIIFMATWHHNEWNRNPWSSSERFCEKQQWLVFSDRSDGKKLGRIVFYHSNCFTIEYWITQEKVVRNTIKYFLSFFSIKSLVFEAAYLSRVRLFFFAYLVENDQKLNSDEANNFENNINLTMINWVEEKMICFRIWLSSIWLLNTTWD